jgi:hypothetical protein
MHLLREYLLGSPLAFGGLKLGGGGPLQEDFSRGFSMSRTFLVVSSRTNSQSLLFTRALGKYLLTSRMFQLELGLRADPSSVIRGAAVLLHACAHRKKTCPGCHIYHVGNGFFMGRVFFRHLLLIT